MFPNSKTHLGSTRLSESVCFLLLWILTGLISLRAQRRLLEGKPVVLWHGGGGPRAPDLLAVSLGSDLDPGVCGRCVSADELWTGQKLQLRPC